MTFPVGRMLRGLLLPLALVLLWHYASRQGAGWAYAFVPLTEIGRSFFALLWGGEFGTHVVATLATNVVGLVCGSAVGFLLGSTMAMVRPIDLLLQPVVNTLRQVPTIGFIPLIALWFGTSQFSITLLVGIAAFEVMTLNTREGLRMVEPRYLEVGRALLFTPLQRFRRILLPAALPSIVTGLLQAVSFTWMATIGAELLFTTGPGLGVVMQRAQIQMDMGTAMVCLIAIGAMGYAMNAFCVSLGRRVLRGRQAG